MKKLALLCLILTTSAHMHGVVIPLIKIAVGTGFSFTAYKAAQAGNACGAVATDIANADNPGAPTLAMFPAIGAAGLWSYSVVSATLGGLLLFQGIKSLIK